jgi:UDP-N-acetylglucosamine acyltransferase
VAANVHPTAVIEGDVVLGSGTSVGAFSYLRGPLVVGDDTRIYPHVIIGTEGEHKSRASTGVIRIGSGVVVRELVVIQRGTGDAETAIGDGSFIMDHCHVAHDVTIAAGVTLSPNVVLGGHSHVLDGATLGIGAVTHQFSTIGAYAMIGMGAVVTRDVPPFCLAAGNPARFRRLNTHAIEAGGFVAAELRIVDGELRAAGPRLQACLDEFARHVRRKVLPLG